MRITRTLHNAWCWVRGNCGLDLDQPPEPKSAETYSWLVNQEREADEAIQRRRRRYQDIERDLFGPYEKHRPKGNPR